MRATDSSNLAFVGLGALVLGGAAGFVAGMLSAPASGRETRRRLGQRLEGERDEVVRKGQRVLNHAVDRVEKGIDSGRRRLNRRLTA